MCTLLCTKTCGFRGVWLFCFPFAPRFLLSNFEEFLLLNSNLLGGLWLFENEVVFPLCCSLNFAHGAIVLLLTVHKMHIELDFLFSCPKYWWSPKKKEKKKEISLCFKQEWSCWQTVQFHRLALTSRLAANSDGEMLPLMILNRAPSSTAYAETFWSLKVIFPLFGLVAFLSFITSKLLAKC